MIISIIIRHWQYNELLVWKPIYRSYLSFKLLLNLMNLSLSYLNCNIIIMSQISQQTFTFRFDQI